MNNKTIWITGASSGIGKSLALKFAQEGWKVAISARRENLLDEISKSNEEGIFVGNVEIVIVALTVCTRPPSSFTPIGVPIKLI